MTTISTIALLCMISATTNPKDAAVRQHNCQKWYISCLEKNKTERGLVYELKQCIKKR